MSLLSYLLVLAGGMLGGAARFFVSGVVGRWIGQTFPWGTLVVNVMGCLVIGMIAAGFRREGGSQGDWMWNFAVVGVLGGYTTVSSFTLQTINLALDGEMLQAVFNVVASTLLCLAAVAAGYWLISVWG